MNARSHDTPPAEMHVRMPDIGPEKASLLWSRVAEFAIAYNGYSVIIPQVEYYLNNTINQVRIRLGKRDPVLDEELLTFVRQEVQHSRYHNSFNQCMFEQGIEGLPELAERVSNELKTLSQSRSLAFNVAYCAGFESIATFDARYLFEECDRFFEGADPHGANLLLWHVAEEFEHRGVCHDAFKAISGNYFLRMYGLFYAFWHVGGVFLEAEKLVLEHYCRDLSADQRRRSLRRSRALFWRQIRYVAPRMLRILLPGYHPGRLPVPARIAAALERFRSTEPITERVNAAA